MNRCPFVRRSAAPFSTPAESAGSMPRQEKGIEIIDSAVLLA